MTHRRQGVNPNDIYVRCAGCNNIMLGLLKGPMHPARKICHECEPIEKEDKNGNDVSA